MQKKPDIWDDTPFHTSRNTVLGALACWAVRQSPYLVPAGLAEAVHEFSVAFGIDDDGCVGVFETDCQRLRKQVFECFSECSSILAWNECKSGTTPAVVGSSRYDRPHPDNDIIDLDALARNIAHSITVEEKYEQEHGPVMV
jgi:hypothetical protein